MIALSVLGLLAATNARAQQGGPHIGYVYPAGGRQGSTFLVTVGGQYLEAAADARVSGAGVEAEVVDYNRPLSPGQFNQLRDRLRELLARKAAAEKDGGRGRGRARTATRPAWTAEDEKTLADIRKKLANPPKRQLNPAIAETVTVEVKIAPDAEPGDRELRLRTPQGMTNPLVFRVGQFPEFSKKGSRNNDAPPPGRPLRNRDEQVAVPPTEMNITLPATVNGQILQGGVDRFRFKARRGQQLVAAVAARALIPYLPDAVPGWFQATLALYDAKGKELAYDDDYRFHPDPVLFYRIPRDGEYYIEIKDAIYRGREDFVYRVTLGEVPFVTGIFPLGGKAGTKTTVEIRGWNLPQDSLTYDAADLAPGIYDLFLKKGDLFSNRVPFAVDDLPEALEKEPDNDPGSAVAVSLPIIVNGRIDAPGDRDVFRFEGRAGDEVVAEVYARRLDSPLDSVLTLTDAAGKQLAFNDDHEDKAAGLTTHHADSWLRATLPADGTYFVYLGDAQDTGGPEYAYRLRISRPRPDFALRVVPSNISVRAGASAALTVYALRKDGFAGEITLALKDTPPGWRLSGGRIPADQDHARCTLSAPRMPEREPRPLTLEGRATIGGRQVVRPAVPAEDMMQAFAYRHLVPAKEWLVCVPGRWMQRNMVKILSPTPVKIPAGGTARVQVTVPTETFLGGKVELELSEPPEGITLQSVSPLREGAELLLKSDAGKVKPGLKGNLIVDAFAQRAPSPGQDKPKTGRRRIPMGPLPAIPFEIVAR
ncbi:MAG TPA: peptidase [Phycisphaerae bacterium]|nr:peptidase [Phycisphaerae bacterium]